MSTLYYDVMPKDFTAFLRWRAITINDDDGDGLNSTHETSIGKSDIYRYDSDSDGLNDKYNMGIRVMKTYKKYLIIGFANGNTGCEIWKYATT